MKLAETLVIAEAATLRLFDFNAILLRKWGLIKTVLRIES